MYGIIEALFVFGHVTQLSCTLYNTYHANVIVLFMVSSQGPIEGFHLAIPRPDWIRAFNIQRALTTSLP